jgi:hypothetical protein
VVVVMVAMVKVVTVMAVMAVVTELTTVVAMVWTISLRRIAQRAVSRPSTVSPWRATALARQVMGG